MRIRNNMPQCIFAFSKSSSIHWVGLTNTAWRFPFSQSNCCVYKCQRGFHRNSPPFFFTSSTAMWATDKVHLFCYEVDFSRDVKCSFFFFFLLNSLKAWNSFLEQVFRNVSGYQKTTWKKRLHVVKAFSCYRKNGNRILPISAHLSAFAVYLLLIY